MTQWWGQHDVPEGQQRRWRIGPATVWVERLLHEWRVAWEATDDDDAAVEAGAPCEPVNLLDRENVARFGVQDDSSAITVRPALADRPVVTRPEKPFAVPAGHTITLFVGSPLWFQLGTGDEATALFDEPIARPSDTWFGPNTRTGELCYAGRTACRLRLDDLRVRPHRAVTAVTIRNRSASALALERLKLPVIYLGIHRSETGTLWTEGVELVNLDDQELAPLQIAKSPPAVAGTTERIAGPRQVAETNVLVRAFSSFFE